MARIEAGRHAAHFLEAAEKETGADEQRDSESDLGAYKIPLQRSEGRDLCPVIRSKRGRKRAARGDERRHNSKDQRGGDGASESIQREPPIEGDLFGAGKRFGQRVEYPDGS